MSNSGRLAAEIVAHFYEGVVAPEAWHSGLNGLCRLSGSSHAALTTWDRQSNAAAIHESVGLTAECRRQFVDHYCMLDPARDHIDRISPGQWYIDHLDVGLPAMRRSPFYQDFLRQFGLGSVIAAPLARDNKGDSFLVLQYALGKQLQHVPPELSSVLPHLCRALKLQGHFQSVCSQATLAGSVLASLHVPVMVLDGSAHIILANDEAELALARHRCLKTVAGRLVLDGASALRFGILLAGACTSKPPRVASAMLIHDIPGLVALQVLIAPLPQWHAGCQDAVTPRALILLHDPLCTLDSHGALLQQLYGLTPAEVRIALALLRGATPRACAAASGVSLATVRTQLSAVLQKTDTARQSELVHLLGTLALLGGEQGQATSANPENNRAP